MEVKNEISYNDKVFKYMLDMKPNDIIEVNSLTKEETRSKFIEVVKYYIDVYGDVEFNADYTKIKKLENW